jgi:hypothetical protein
MEVELLLRSARLAVNRFSTPIRKLVSWHWAARQILRAVQPNAINAKLMAAVRPASIQGLPIWISFATKSTAGISDKYQKSLLRIRQRVTSADHFARTIRPELPISLPATTSSGQRCLLVRLQVLKWNWIIRMRCHFLEPDYWPAITSS